MTAGPDGSVEPGAEDDAVGARAFDDTWGDAAVDQSEPDESTAVDAGEAGSGNERVDEAVARLAELDGLPTSEHADVYEDVHRRLHTALTELDDD
jgi:hypothetical protein